MAHRTLVGLSILSSPPSLVCSYERLAAEACARGSPPRPPSKLRYECAILPMVAGGNLLTVMAPAAQHTRSFLFAHNCDEETALFGERVGGRGRLCRLCAGHAGKVKRSETTPIMEAVANVNGANERPAVQTASGRAIQT